MYYRPFGIRNRGLSGNLTTAAPGALQGAASGATSGFAVAGPIGAAVGGAAGAVAGLVAGLLTTPLSGVQKQQATNIVNYAEPILRQNLAAYESGGHTRSEQAAALQNFTDVWSWVFANCNVTSLGVGGSACINDRERGGRWDWFAYYYDPIANDPDVVADPASALTSIFTGASASGGSSLLLPAALIGLAFLLSDK